MDNFINKAEYILQAVAIIYPWFFPVLMVVLGGIFGSFLTCMVYRIPRKINPSFPPSYCPSCNNKLKIIDLIPVLSWLIFKGKCRRCEVSIPFRYIAIELLIIVWALTSLVLTTKLIGLPFLFFAGVGFIFTILCLIMEKTFTPKVLLFSCILLAVFLYITL